MANKQYTYRDKKMISDYLENNLLYHDIEDDQLRMIDQEELFELIHSLKSTEFKDIKNQIGTIFSIKNAEYSIIYNSSIQCYYYMDMKSFRIYELSDINDNTLVQIIKVNEVNNE